MTKIKGEFRLLIQRDDDPQNPRTEYDNFGTMCHWHPNMDVGEERVTQPCNQEEYDELTEDYGIVVPVYMYEHSGIALSTQPFTCAWDSGQVGFIAVTMDTVRVNYLLGPGDPISDEIQNKAIALMQTEVKIYDDFINGNVWGFTLEQMETCDCCGNINWECIDGVSGFSGGEDATRDAIDEHIADIHKHLLNDAWENRT